MNSQTQQIISTLSDFKARSSDKYNISVLGVFGSFARGEAKESSDVDIAVEFTYATLLSLSRMQEELEGIFGRKVDIVSLKASMLPGFREEIMRDIIYV